MIQRCLGRYPSVEAHHEQWEELLAEDWNRLFGCEGSPEGCPWERGICCCTCSVSVNLPCFLTHHTPPNFRYVLDLFLMELSRDLVDYPLCHPYD